MARINIEDSLFKDGRYADLILATGSRHSALGAIVEAFMIAQEFFLNEETFRMIPMTEWKRRRAVDAVITVGLAEIKREIYVYVLGSNEQFAWLLQKQAAGRKKISDNRTISDDERTSSVGNPPFSCLLSPPLTQSSTQSFDFEILYKMYPRKEGKSAGFKKCEKIKTQKEYDLLKRAIEIYSAKVIREKTEIQFIKQFSTFMTSWRDWLEYKPTKIASANKMISNRDAQIQEQERKKFHEESSGAIDPKIKEMIDNLKKGKSIPTNDKKE